MAEPGYEIASGAARTDALAQLTLVLLVSYIVVNRLVADIYTLPVGASVRPAEVVAVLVLIVWVLWMIASRGPLPVGVAGLLATALLVVLVAGPMLNAGNMSVFEANGAERGVIRGLLFAGLFIAAYRIARNLHYAYVVVWSVLGFTMMQAVMAIYEGFTKLTFPYLGLLWVFLGMEVDPKGIRGELVAVRYRLTGEARASATAPNPIVLSALLAVGIGIAVILYLNTESRRKRRVYLIAMVVQLAAMGVTASRTGFLLLFVAAAFVLISQVRRLPRALPLVGSLMLGGVVLAALAPRTPRLILNFFSNPGADHNVTVRVSKIEAITGLLESRPLIGAGYLTHNPRTVIFDNSYFAELVELGVLGLTILFAFFLVVTFRSYSTLSAGTDAERPILLIGVVAGLALLVGGATFDAWSFDQFFPTCLILMAMALSRADRVRQEVAVLSQPGEILCDAPKTRA